MRLALHPTALLGVFAFAALLAAPRAQAQDTSADPNYGTVTLRAGFTPDPHTTRIAAGGTVGVDVSGCNGTVSESPDINLRWSGRRSTLYIYTTSDEDTTLLVNLPNGRWSCDDDTIGLNPLVIVRNAPAGLYNIWAGTFGDTASARVMISEVDPR